MNKHEQDAELYLNQLQYLTMKDLPKEVEERIKAGFAQVLKKETGEVEAISDSEEEEKSCSVCHGWTQVMAGGDSVECHHCNGTGEEPKERDPEEIIHELIDENVKLQEEIERLRQGNTPREGIEHLAQIDIPNFIKSAFQILVGTGEDALKTYMKAHNIEIGLGAPSMKVEAEKSEGGFEALADELYDWSNKTFGERPALAPVYHLKKEVVELIEVIEHAPDNWRAIESELADCFLLITDASRKHGLTPAGIISNARDKFEKAKLRKWGEPDENGVIEHIRESVEAEKSEGECPNCKEIQQPCACIRNTCHRCKNPVGNITFSICDDCWKELFPSEKGEKVEAIGVQPEGRSEGDLVASSSNTDDASLVSHTCTVGNSFEQLDPLEIPKSLWNDTDIMVKACLNKASYFIGACEAVKRIKSLMNKDKNVQVSDTRNDAQRYIADNQITPSNLISDIPKQNQDI